MSDKPRTWTSRHELEAFQDGFASGHREMGPVLDLLEGLYRAVNRMPDAGLATGDPRYEWWMETFPQRDAVARFLREHGRLK